MKVFYSNDFTGIWPVGTSAVVVAPDEENANRMLSDELGRIGMRFDGTLVEIDVGKQHAIVLQDGNY